MQHQDAEPQAEHALPEDPHIRWIEAPHGPEPELPEWEDLELRSCNLVMKGGVTSGVVFPGAIRVLATRYRFKQLGGTSAGAIAAVFAAAAEYRRREGGQSAGFDAMWQISQDLSKPATGSSGKTVLEALFAPNHATTSLYHVMSAVAHSDRSPFRPLRVSLALARSYPLPAALIAVGVAGSAVGFKGLIQGTGKAEASVTALAGTWTALAGLGTLTWTAVVGGHRALRRNHLGLSTGHEHRATSEEPLRFTNWLHRSLQGIIGRPPNQPLTFGDLAPKTYAAARNPAQRDKMLGNLSPGDLQAYDKVTATDIHLRQITTHLTEGRPVVLPFDAGTTDAKGYYFRPDEWAEYFPPDVLKHLCDHSERKVAFTEAEARAGRFEYYRLPPPEHFPVVVSTRMSMSFPGLFSVVPLYGPGFLKKPRDPDVVDAWSWRAGVADLEPGKARFAPVRFGDGGLTSNFPLTLFDELVPSEPTFALNLEYGRPLPHGVPPPDGHKPGMTSWVYLVEPEPLREDCKDDKDASLNWRPLPRRVDSVPKYVSSIIEAARNWSDTSMIALPGYAECVAHIVIGRGLGGTNLAMDASQIFRLRRLGVAAGQLLLERFTRPPGTWDWEVHRAAGFVTLTADMERLLQDYARVFGPKGTMLLPGLNRVPLQSQPVTYFPIPSAAIQAAVTAFLNAGGNTTTLRGYRRLRGKRAVLRYRPLA